MNTGPGNLPRRRGRRCILLLNAGITVLLAWQLLSPAHHFFRWDTIPYVWPLYLEAQSYVLSGEVPFWASSFCCGTPILANISASVLYPLRWIHWPLPVDTGYKLFLLAHVVLSFAGMHLLLRRGLRLGTAAAVVGALCFGAGGYARGMWDTFNFLALPWIPLGYCALLEATRPGGARRAVIGASLCGLMLLLGGDTQALVMWFAFGGLLAVMHPSRRTLLPVMVAAMAFTLLLGAPQWLPTAHAVPLSYRAEGLSFETATERSFHPARLLELFVPHLFGTHATWYAQSLFGGGSGLQRAWTASFHIGVIALLPVAMAWRRRSRLPAQWAALITVTSLLLSFGRFLPGFEWWLRLPVVGGFRYPEKYLLWTGFGLSMLAAIGTGPLLSLWRRARFVPVRNRVFLGWIVAMIALAAVAIGLAPRAYSPARPDLLEIGYSQWLGHRGIAAALMLAASVSLIFCRSFRCATWALLSLVFIGLAVPWYLERPLTTEFDPMAEPPLARIIRTSPAPCGRYLADPAARVVPLPDFWPELQSEEARRTVYFSSLMNYNGARVWGGRTADGFSALESAAMQAARRDTGRPVDGSVPEPAALARFCRQAAVRWLLTTPARGEQLVSHGLTISEAARWKGDPEDSVLLLLGNTPEVRIQGEDGSIGATEPACERPRPGAIEVRLPGAETGLRLVISETHDPGWSAVDQDGNPLLVSAHDGLTLEVRVPAGTSRVRLKYVAPGWGMGWLIAIPGVLGLAGVLFAPWPRHDEG